MKLTEKQKREIYCVKHGHAKFVTMCFGYVYCGRCGVQIGDTLAGIFDLKNYLVVGHKDCQECNDIRRKLSKANLRILEKLEKDALSG